MSDLADTLKGLVSIMYRKGDFCEGTAGLRDKIEKRHFQPFTTNSIRAVIRNGPEYVG